MTKATGIALALAILVTVVLLAIRYGATRRDRFKTVEGVEVSNLDGIHEGYSISRTERGYYHFTINVSAGNISNVYRRLTSEVSEPAFFLVELGTLGNVEKDLRKTEEDPFHKDVYYLDGITRARGAEIFSMYEDLLVNDGMVTFGFGAHEGHDEVFVGAYKIFEIYADKPDKYAKALAELGIPKKDILKTVWQSFTRTTPGRLNALRGRSKTIWDMVEELKEQGMYMAERRER